MKLVRDVAGVLLVILGGTMALVAAFVFRNEWRAWAMMLVAEAEIEIGRRLAFWDDHHRADKRDG